MLKKIISFALSTVVCTTALSVTAFAETSDTSVLAQNNANEQIYSMTDDQILLQTGMDQSEIGALDKDIKSFIVSDLKNSGELNDIAYVNTEDVPTPAPRVKQSLYGINFSVSSFRSSNTVYIYPTYEFTTDKRPRGEDSFAFQFGEALRPYQYGGQLWYKDYTKFETNSQPRTVKKDIAKQTVKRQSKKQKKMDLVHG